MYRMDQRTQEYFDSILKKEPIALNETEIKFLRARSSYLKKAQLEEYESVLYPKETKPVEKQTVKKQNATTK